jgi:predicted NAD-dependent protein-ADP-ribosyltransferase YbiA (DUF1768 family)
VAIPHRLRKKRPGSGAVRLREARNLLTASHTFFGELGKVCKRLQNVSMPIRRNTLLVATLSLAAISFAQTAKQYPAHWWAPVSDGHKPDWEILPQAAKPGEVVLSKRNELGILSNFAATPFTLYGKRYASVEGFWQMMLYPEGPSDPRAKAPRLVWRFTREQVAQMTSFQAKDAGTRAEENSRKIGIDWVTFEGRRFSYRSMQKGEHYQLIREAMLAKLNQNPKVRATLLSTGTLILRPDHIQEQNAPPEWRYFEMWMEIRSNSSPRLH